MDYSTPRLPVHHRLPEFTQTHVQRLFTSAQIKKKKSQPYRKISKGHGQTENTHIHTQPLYIGRNIKTSLIERNTTQIKTSLKYHFHISHWKNLKSNTHTLFKKLWRNKQSHRPLEGEQNDITSIESNTYENRNI